MALFVYITWRGGEGWGEGSWVWYWSGTSLANSKPRYLGADYMYMYVMQRWFSHAGKRKTVCGNDVRPGNFLIPSVFIIQLGCNYGAVNLQPNHAPWPSALIHSGSNKHKTLVTERVQWQPKTALEVPPSHWSWADISKFSHLNSPGCTERPGLCLTEPHP